MKNIDNSKLTELLDSLPDCTKESREVETHIYGDHNAKIVVSTVTCILERSYCFRFTINSDWPGVDFSLVTYCSYENAEYKMLTNKFVPEADMKYDTGFIQSVCMGLVNSTIADMHVVKNELLVWN